MTNTIRITNERLNLFVVCGKAYLSNAPKSKLWYAVDKITKIALKKLKKVEKEMEEKRREFALQKDKGVYDLTEKGGWQFNKEGHEKLVNALTLINEQEVEIPVHIVPNDQFDDKDLSFDLRNNFEGIVIPAIDYETFDIDNYVEPKKEDTPK